MSTHPSPHTRLGSLYLGLGIAQTAHSIEEMLTHLYEFFWVTTGIIHRHLASFPQFRMPPETFAVVNMSLIALLLGTVPFVQAQRRWALFLAAVAGVTEVLNGIGHLSGAAYFRGYVPGAGTAPLLIVVGTLLLAELRRSGALTAR